MKTPMLTGARHGKTHWISMANIAKHERAYTKATRWATYAKRQANKQTRANARYDITERLEDITFGPLI